MKGPSSPRRISITGQAEPPQAVIRIIPRGGARTATQIRDQWRYLSRKGHVQLQRSERHQGIFLPKEEWKSLAQSWAEETGYVHAGHAMRKSPHDLTTHIIVSFPPGTELGRAFAAGREWAEEVFGSGHSGARFDYITACHSDRPHPHVHVVLNRRAIEGSWLKIAKRHACLNYERLRAAAVAVASRHDIVLAATSRLERGIANPPITYSEYRRRERVENR